MSSPTDNVINQTSLSQQQNSDTDIAMDERYQQESMRFIKEALRKGMDVAHMPNGDFMVTETKIVTYRYRWNENRKRFDRSNTLARKSRKASAESS